MCEIDYDKILVYLDGFILTPDVDDDYPADTEYNKIITSDEINEFYTIAELNTKTYIDLNETDTLNPLLQQFIYMWTAGLIYKKYDIRPNDQTDDTMPIGYGDQLIITAKAGLKPYKKYTMEVW